MCGINGIVSTALFPESIQQWIQAMNDALVHRGPDDEGVWFGNQAAFGHRRLTIIDTSDAGRQPIRSADESLVLVCNGEIYNYPQLRQRYQEKGYPFKSQTDIEVILPLYQEYGDGCVDHLVGMFAFAIWDAPRRRLLLARDRIGEKPLCYHTTERGIAFSSEIKGLLRLPWIQPELNEEAVANMLIYQSAPAPLSFFKEIHTLPPASTLVWEEGRTRVERYWHVDFAKKRNWRWDEALDTYGTLIQQSVNGCMLSDVPIGVTLSGGVDSSTIALKAAETRADLRTFCVGHDTPDKPDPEFARSQFVADRLGTQHQLIHFDLSDLGRLPFVIAQYDQPFNNYAMLYADILAKTMSREVKVIVSGNGADEVFGGYRGYNQYILHQWMAPWGRRLPSTLAQVFPGRWRSKGDRFFQYAKEPLFKWQGLGFDNHFQELLGSLCTDDFSRRWKSYTPGRFVADQAEEAGAETLIDATMYADLMVNHHHGHATMGDISGMTHGLEIRSPFLDFRLIEFAASLPRHMLIPSWRDSSKNKLVMKRFLSRHLPKSFVHAGKMGFGYGINFWDYFNGPWRQAIERQVFKGRYLELGIFSPEGARNALQDSLSRAWMMLSFSIWADLNLFNETPEQIAKRLVGGS